MAIRKLCSFLQLCLIGLLHSESNVLPGADGKQDGLLRDDCHVSPEERHFQLFHVNSIDSHSTSLAVIETLQQGHAAGLATARLADQSHHLVGICLKADVFEHLRIWAGCIVKAHFVKLNFPLAVLRLQGSICLCWFTIDDLENLLRRTDGRREGWHDAAKHCHRSRQAHSVENKGDQIPRAHLIFFNQACTEAQHNGEGNEEE
mmetsp:Transcript_3612/g.8404  ORF Transcript_3612/g.8404 Transcript_3612/m.8404 type:complete len:204 (-) Transcript_3612:683-1294(-)